MKVRYITIMILFVSNILIFAPNTPAQVLNVTVSVDGMVCPFCTYGVEKNLKDVDGVKSVKIDLKKATATLIALKDKAIDINEIPNAIKQSGFTPGGIKAQAFGIIEIDDAYRFYLQALDGTRLFFLHKMTKTQKSKLHPISTSGSKVLISGNVHVHKNAIPALSIEAIEEVKK